jgi:hypothetical protein
MDEFERAWLNEFGCPAPILGPCLKAFYLLWVRRAGPCELGPNMADKIKSLVDGNYIGDSARLYAAHVRVMRSYRTNHLAVPRGHNRYLLKAIEVALEDLDFRLEATDMIDNN